MCLFGDHLVHVLLVPILRVGDSDLGPARSRRPCSSSASAAVIIGSSCEKSTGAVGDLRGEHDLVLDRRPPGRCSPARRPRMALMCRLSGSVTLTIPSGDHPAAVTVSVGG